MHLTPSHMFKILTRKSANHLPHLDDSDARQKRLRNPIEGIWARHDRICKARALQNEPVFVVGFSEADTVVMRAMLRQIGLGPCAFCLAVDTLQDLATFRNAFSFLLVNIDAFEDSDAAVTALLALRSQRDDLVTLLVSAKVAMDDLGAERRLICDATLRFPVSPLRLQRGVAAAFDNHKSAVTH